MIEDPDRTKEIRDVIARSYTSYGMQTFDQGLMWLWRHNYITYDEALKQSSSPSNFALRASGIAATSDDSWTDFDLTSGTPTGSEPGPGSTSGQ